MQDHRDKLCKIVHETVERIKEEYDIVDNTDAVSEWIPCSERLPEEQEWLGTKMFGTTMSDAICITFEDNRKRFVKVMSLQNGELSNSDKEMMDVFHKGWKMLAWMPLPRPYKEDK